MLLSASQAAQAVIVNASVDLLLAFNQREHFVNHSSTLHAKYALELAALKSETLPAVNPDETVKSVSAFTVDAIENTGTELQVITEFCVNTE